MSEDFVEQYIDKNGYYRYCLSDRLVHRAVAEHGLGKDIRGKVVHHKNYNKLDNRPENLEVMTEEEHSALHDDDYDFCYNNQGGRCVDCGDRVSKSYHKYCTSCYFERRDEKYGEDW